MNLFDRYLTHIDNEISINDEDRSVNAHDFGDIRDYVLNTMKQMDSAFNKMFGGTRLFGSFSNNVRIIYPDEFDVHFILNIPYSEYLGVTLDQGRPGFVRLNFKETMEKLEKYKPDSSVYELLDEMVDWKQNYLRRSNLQRWLKDLIEDGLDTFGNVVHCSYGNCYTLEYSKRGLAHTVFARCGSRSISIDFIPAIAFGQIEWMEIPNCHQFRFKCDEWFAIPKPTRGSKFTRKYAFMICNSKVEHDLLLEKQNLKVVFRLLKSLRNEYEMKRLKSYFITTAFLWEIMSQDQNFWFNSVDYLLVHMLDVLSDYFIHCNLPFFWDKDLNLLDVLSDEEIDDYKSKLCKAYNTLSSYHHQSTLTFGRVASHFQLPEM